MIRYSLRCEAGHEFESWFAGAAAFDSLSKAGQLACAICGSPRVEKTLMLPAVRPGRKAEARAEPRSAEGGAPAPSLSGEATALEQTLAAMRRHVEENSEYVGMNFASEARRIHDGDSPERAIYGEAKPDEARRLIEDGVKVAPLPFLPRRRAN
ncbi:DUF1178 family protein [Pseudogemmobacter humi]|uniref:DUF1178 family protein n=1 Tax=Pseudogemmobacter humi TaxID=2483812 RepID=A0A3P5XRS1_9RHOB|nr:DUF1178 family protein [Pseudogemmobacter humi]VDC31663.1 hypothetical protein XINFAN_03037 [Pseudogemmobacter humi]